MAPSRIEIDRILCPVDFSEFSGPALERAIRLGEWFDARVEVLHVIPSLPLAMSAGLAHGYYPDSLEVTSTQQEHAAKSLDELVSPFVDQGVTITTRVLEGEPWRVILAEANGLPLDLLVLGTHGRGGFERLLLGSVTEKVLRRAPCPVLTVGHVRAHAMKGPLFRRILCAADLTASSPRTLDLGLSLATENDAQITLLHVLETPAGETGPRSHLAVPEIGSLRHELVAQARADLRNAVSETARSFCEVTERVETGAPWREILRVAEQIDSDLIVMGAHTQGTLGLRFFGSTANHVVRRATCPVLVLHESQRPPVADEVEAVGSAHRQRRVSPTS
jgi:nucleotide-binding universal stress UspA family protein